MRQILNVIKDADFHSGRCFRDVAVTESTERPPERASMLQVCPCALCIRSFLLICIDVDVVLQYFLESLKPFTHPMLGCDERLAKYAKVLTDNIVLY